MRTALLIMAAGIGSRYGGGIKQLATVDDRNHIIMDYSVHDAIAAGFNKIIFVIRREIEADFRAIIGNRMEKVCRAHNVEVCYVFQDLRDIPKGFALPEGRKKPWGTGQAVLSARNCIREPFAVVNADDYYGKEAFRKLHDFLTTGVGERDFCMAGFVLKNTLSEFGTVTRGICQVDGKGFLTEIAETKQIAARWDRDTGRMKVFAGSRAMDPENLVSMNMWGLTPKFLTMLEAGFEDFLRRQMPLDPEKAEFLIPIFIGQLLEAGAATVRMLPTNDKWFGVTYQEDKPFVAESFRQLIEAGVYREDLYSDL